MGQMKNFSKSSGDSITGRFKNFGLEEFYDSMVPVFGGECERCLAGFTGATGVDIIPPQQ